MKALIVDDIIDSCNSIHDMQDYDLFGVGLYPLYMSRMNMRGWFMSQLMFDNMVYGMWLYGQYPKDKVIICDSVQDAIMILLKMGYTDIRTIVGDKGIA